MSASMIPIAKEQTNATEFDHKPDPHSEKIHE